VLANVELVPKPRNELKCPLFNPIREFVKEDPERLKPELLKPDPPTLELAKLEVASDRPKECQPPSETPPR